MSNLRLVWRFLSRYIHSPLSSHTSQFILEGTFYSTGGRPPFKPDAQTPTNTNECVSRFAWNLAIHPSLSCRPYLEWVQSVLSQHEVPLVISTSYGEHEQTGMLSEILRVPQTGFNMLSARGLCSTCMCRFCTTRYVVPSIPGLAWPTFRSQVHGEFHSCSLPAILGLETVIPIRPLISVLPTTGEILQDSFLHFRRRGC